ncbi:hypothetical protein GCM10009610_20570 [Pseudonocardia xinjiangensis]
MGSWLYSNDHAKGVVRPGRPENQIRGGSMTDSTGTQDRGKRSGSVRCEPTSPRVIDLFGTVTSVTLQRSGRRHHRNRHSLATAPCITSTAALRLAFHVPAAV